MSERGSHQGSAARPSRTDEPSFRALIENTSELVSLLAPDLTVIFQAGSVLRQLGYEPGELAGTKFTQLVDPADLTRLRARCADAADGVAHPPLELRLKYHDGRWLDAETLVRFDGGEGYLVLTTRDISERKRAEQALARRAAQQSTVAQLGTEALAGEELTELLDHVCREVARTLHADHVEVFEYLSVRDSFVLLAGLGDGEYLTRGTSLPARGTAPALALRSSHPVIVRDWSAEPRFEEAASVSERGLRSGVSVPIPGAAEPFGVISVCAREPHLLTYEDGIFLRAIANTLAAAIGRFADEEKIRHQALHDHVTGTPNRTLFEDRLTQALATVSRHGGQAAVLFLDLDNFKRLNDSLGHEIGDGVLKAVVGRISGCLRAEDTLARFGGDEFAVLLPRVDRDEDAIAVVERIGAALKAPLTVEGRQIVITASVGIALSRSLEPGQEARVLVRAADLAMYAAKQRGRGGWEFFADHMHESAVQRFDLTGELYQALERSELEVHYQPIVTLRNEEIVGLEALVRWNHPRHGFLSPAVFLPLAVETGLIVPLGRFVLRTACESLQRWQHAQPRHRGLYMTVNLTTQELRAPDLVTDLRAILSDTGVDPGSLVLEITEEALLETGDDVVSRLDELKGLGIRLAIDDFGTGYSALSYLQNFPMDILKLDKSFVDRLGGSSDQERLVKGIIELAHDLGLETVAEGIERADQAAALRAMDSELGQGFHFARPLTRSDIELILAPVADPNAVGAQSFSIGTPTRLPHSVHDPS